jgi:hypothetical protein
VRDLTRRQFGKYVGALAMSLLITPHFSVAEFACHCSDPNCDRKESPDVDSDFIQMLEELRMQTFALRISSGVRCLKHDLNISPKKNKNGGVHVQAIACDILVGHLPSADILKLTTKATAIGFTGLGFSLANSNRSKRFLHLDSRSGGAIWSY